MQPKKRKNRFFNLCTQEWITSGDETKTVFLCKEQTIKGSKACEGCTIPLLHFSGGGICDCLVEKCMKTSVKTCLLCGTHYHMYVSSFRTRYFTRQDGIKFPDDTYTGPAFFSALHSVHKILKGYINDAQHTKKMCGRRLYRR